MKRSGRKSAAQTPAPESDRIKGSNVNKPGSASSKESASDIFLSESIIEVLREKADTFNEEHPGNRVGLPELKAVMRRGMGAYSTSHRPTISGGMPNSRTAWGYARVNRFLEKKAGKKVKDAYVQDDDLLESGGITYSDYVKTQFNEEEDWHLPSGYLGEFEIHENTKSQYPILHSIKDGYEYRLRSEKDSSIGVFDSDKQIGYADNKAVQVSPMYQKKGIGLQLVTILKERNPNHRFGSMTPEGFNLMGKYYDVKIASKKYAKGGSVELLAPNGERSNLSPEQYRLVRTPEFKAWFGDWENDPGNASKVVDENGEPLVVYHGTFRQFTTFDISKVGVTDKGFFSKGFYFTPIESLAYTYGNSVKECFLSIKNPIITKSRQDLANYLGLEYNNNTYAEIAREKIISLDYDGVFQEYNLPKGTMAKYPFIEIVAYYPSQIKLADGSNTTFDGENPDIRFDEGGSVELLAPNGQPSNLSPEQYRLVRTPEFKEWFGDWENDPGNASKVVDENGEPLVVWHGSNKEFNTFKYGEFGFHFGGKNAAKERGDIVKPYFLSVKKILWFDYDIGDWNDFEMWNEYSYAFEGDEYMDFLSALNNSKDIEEFKNKITKIYNGIKYFNAIEGDLNEYSFIVFEPNQIKLADGSNTTFDGETPDIRFDEGGRIPPNFEIGASYPYPPAELSDYIKDLDYWAAIRKFYFEGEDAPLSSRYHPYLGELPEVGSWRISRLNLMDGHQIDYLAELPIDILIAKELDSEGNLDAAKRGDDERYAEWIKAGFRSIPIEVTQREDGKFLITDGHRRYLAHKLAGQNTIEAWVSYSAISPRGTIVGLTYELAHPDKQIPSFEGGGAINEANDLTFASYDDALLWLEKESKKYKSKNDFYSSYEYKKVYPVINELYMLERRKDESKEREEAKIAMEQAGVKFGDRVGYDYIYYLQVEEYTGEVVSRNGIPYVKLDEGQQTMSGKKSVKWHKGWRKITDGEQTIE